MDRRAFLGTIGALAIPRIGRGQADACASEKAEFTLRISNVTVELAPGKVVKTTGYNQDGKVVITFKRIIMVYKRGQAPRIPRLTPQDEPMVKPEA